MGPAEECVQDANNWSLGGTRVHSAKTANKSGKAPFRKWPGKHYALCELKHATVKKWPHSQSSCCPQ